MEFPHQPVLVKEAVEDLITRTDGVYVDGTCGSGGHSQAIGERLTSSGRLICLDRDPDPGEVQQWSTSLTNGTLTGADVGYGFVLSQEFVNRNTNNEQYLAILYRAFFNRDPDPGGFSYWLNQLNGGALRQDVLDGFIFAQEFSNLCASYGIRVH